jgi:hypothetical protein
MAHPVFHEINSLSKPLLQRTPKTSMKQMQMKSVISDAGTKESCAKRGNAGHLH